MNSMTDILSIVWTDVNVFKLNMILSPRLRLHSHITHEHIKLSCCYFRRRARKNMMPWVNCCQEYGSIAWYSCLMVHWVLLRTPAMLSVLATQGAESTTWHSVPPLKIHFNSIIKLNLKIHIENMKRKSSKKLSAFIHINRELNTVYILIWNQWYWFWHFLSVNCHGYDI